jgi:GrpB-like predicted nucleotidyltransferase (UPF0157 family)
VTSATDPVVLVPHDPAWPSRFAEERDRLVALFAGVDVGIEHVGSTAVPGLAAKPVIDVLLGAPSLRDVEDRIPALAADGWSYVPEHEDALPDRRYFVKSAGGARSHHLHAVVNGSAFWRDHLAFRDFLRTHPADVRAYEALKRDLAAAHRDDRAAYTDGKTAFVRGILFRARLEAG